MDDIDDLSIKAPVIHGNEMQVYYESAGKLRVAWGTGPGALAVGTLDGGVPVVPVNGWVKDTMGFYATAVEIRNPLCIVAQGCGFVPSVFYWDSLNGDIRNAYYQ